MKLVSFSIKNYRSITNAHNLPVRDSLTVLMGPNNEGKSNILRGLVTAMRLATWGPRPNAGQVSPRRSPVPMYVPGRSYNWSADFPVSLQPSNPDGRSEFTLELELDDNENEEFRNTIRSNLNGTLPIVISVSAQGATFRVKKQGRGGKSLSVKAPQIARFVASKLNFQYVPAVRTAESAEEVVNELVGRELQILEQDPEYAEAVRKIASLQKPILDKLSHTISQSLNGFLPAVNKVEVKISERERSDALTRSSTMTIDDGSPTPLNQKGDGVQSLAALCLIQHSSALSAKGKSLILAIEEPESHLHPKAIHHLRTVLSELGDRHQVLVSTHCPLLVDRHNVSANIIVAKSKAAPAKSIAQIRDVLGVRVADNLQSAEVVLVVEGEDDRTALQAILADMSPTLKAALGDNVLAIDSLGGGTKLCYKLTLLRDGLCRYHCLLDDDECGRSAQRAAFSQKLITLRQVTMVKVKDMKEAELEDIYDPCIYADFLYNQCGLALSDPSYVNARGKWTERLRQAFEKKGKPWDGVVEAQIKSDVARLVAARPGVALHAKRKTVMTSLVSALEAEIGS